MTCKEMERQNSTSNGSPNTAFIYTALSYIKSHIYITYQIISSYGAGYIVKH